MGLILLTASILAQAGALIQASRLAWKRRQAGWIMLTIAVGLMLGRRVYVLWAHVYDGQGLDAVTECIGLTISVSQVIGFSWLLKWPIAKTEFGAEIEPVLLSTKRLRQQALFFGWLVVLCVLGLIYATYRTDPAALSGVLGFASALLVVLPVGLALLYQVSAASQQAAVAAISQQRKTAMALLQGESAYRTLLETSHDLVWSMDKEGRFTFLNPAVRAIYGYEPSEMLGRPFKDFADPERVEKDLATFGHLIMSGQGLTNYETVQRRKDGSAVWLGVNAVVLRDEQGAVVGASGTAQDITERKRAEGALRDSEGRMRRLVNSNIQGVIFTDIYGKITLANDAFLKMIGYSRTDMEAGLIDWMKLTPTEYVHLDLRAIKELEARRVCTPWEKEYIRKDGSRVRVLVGVALFDGSQSEGVAFVLDISERSKVEVALQHEQALFSSLIKTVPDHVYFKDRQSRFVRINDIMVRRFGLKSSAEAMGKTDFDFFGEEHASQAYADEQRVMNTGEPMLDVVEKETWPDGRITWVSTTKVAVRDADGSVSGLVGISRDITERKLTEVVRDRSLALILATLESTADGILVVNSDGKIETCNRVFARMWNLPEAVVAAKDTGQLVRCMQDQLSDPLLCEERMSYLREHPEDESSDLLLCQDGRVIERYSRPQMSGGKSVGRVWSFRDITERKQADAALQNSEEKFHALFAQSPLAIVLTTLPEGRVSDANAAAEALLGRRLADVRGLTTTEMQVWVDLEERNRYMKLLQRDGAVNGYEARMRRGDGTEVTVLYSGRAVHFGGQTHILNSMFDITERKQVEEELRQNRAQFIDLFDNAPIGYHEVDAEGRITRSNKTELKMLGYTSGELLGQYVWKITADEVHSHEAVIAKLSGALTSSVVFERSFRRKDGSVFPVLVEDRVLRNDEGDITGIRSVVQDITIHKQAEEKAQHLANFPELNPNPVLEFNAEGALGYHNPAALSMAKKVGFPNLKDLLPPRAKQIVAECLASGQPQLRMETQHGRHTLSWSFYPINAQRVVHCYVGDITKRIQLEEQFRQAQKMEAIGQLSGGVAHDFNNLLTVILGNIGLLQSSGQVTPEVAEPLQAIGHAANRAANLTRQLLAFSRQQVMQQQNLDLNAVVGHISKMLRRVIGETVKIRLDYALQSLPIYADPGMLEQVILNLCLNARDAMPQGGQLTLRTATVDISSDEARLMASARAGSFALMIVSDTGTGIAPENMKRVFEPFFTTKEVGKGTGLGLASVYGIAQQHNGWVTVESELGRGTTFAVYLPLLTAPPVVRTQPAEAGKLPRGTETILLVEDDLAVQMVAKITLARLGYQVLVASNGHQALRIWQERKAEIQLVLTDMIMPEGLSGKDIAQRFKNDLPGIRIIFMSGYSADIAGTDFTPAEGDYFIGKPFEMHALATVIRKSLDTIRPVPTVRA